MMCGGLTLYVGVMCVGLTFCAAMPLGDPNNGTLRKEESPSVTY